MKKLFVFCLLIFSFKSFGQEIKKEIAEAPYNNYNLKFVIAEDSQPVADLFAGAKNYWTFTYELRFLDDRKNLEFTTPTFESNSNLSQSERTKNIKRDNKKHDKAWKKNGSIIVKGKTEKRLLSVAQNREIIIPVQLSESVKTVLSKATASWANPVYRVSMKGKIFIQTEDEAKLKRKFTHSVVCSSKVQTKELQSWAINFCGIYQGVTKQNGKIGSYRTSVIN